MNPTAALMLARTTEDDHRRELCLRQLAQAARREGASAPRSWLDRIGLSRPRMAGSASRA